VVDTYRSQFAADDVQKYELADLRTTGGTAGRAEGRYTVRRGNAAPITGRIVFLVVRRDGEPRIDLIATEPRPA
jgi:serine/threonine-protein kinase